MKNFQRKLKSISGESISEALIALLVAALGITMLAGAILTSGHIILNTEKSLRSYYSADGNMLTRASSSRESDGYAEIKFNPSGSIQSLSDKTSPLGSGRVSIPVEYYKNKKDSRGIVISYNRK